MGGKILVSVGWEVVGKEGEWWGVWAVLVTLLILLLFCILLFLGGSDECGGMVLGNVMWRGGVLCLVCGMVLF